MAQMHFDVWAADDLMGTALGELTDASDKHIRVVENAIGNGQFSINRHSSQFAWCAQENLVRVRRVSGGPFAADDSRYVHAFFIEEGQDELVSADEEGGEIVTRGGRDAVAILRRAIIYPYSSHPDNGIYWERALKDGMVRFLQANFQQGRSVGAVLRTFIRDAQYRSPDPTDPVETSFNYNADSNNDSWVETDTDWEFPVGLDYLELLARLVSAGLWFRMNPDFVLDAWETSQGVDRSATVDFVKGDNIREVAERVVHASPVVSRTIVQGSTDTDELKFREVTDAGVELEVGRREGFVEYGATPTNARLDLAGQKYIDVQKAQYDGPTTIGALDTAGRTAFTDYFAGDTVTVDIPGVWDELAVKIIAINLDETAAGEYDPTLEFLESPWDGQAPAEFATTGTQPGNCRDCPPLEPYVPNPSGGGLECVGPSGALTVVDVSDSGINPTFPFVNPDYAADGNAGTGALRASGAGGGAQHAGIVFDFGGPVALDSFGIKGSISGGSLLDYGGGPEWNCFVEVGDSPGTAGPWYALTGTNSGSPPTTEAWTRTGSAIGGRYLRLRWQDTHSGLHFWPNIEVVELAPVGCELVEIPAVYTPPIPGQQGNEQTPGDVPLTTYVTNFPYVPGTLVVTVDGVVVVANETDPAAGEFQLLVDATGKTIVMRYVIASSTGTGATNPPPDPDSPSGGVTDHPDLAGRDEPDQHPADSVSVADTADWFEGTDVEAALAELAAKVVGYQAHGNLGAAETFDAAIGWHSGTLDANCTLTLTANPSGTVSSLFLELAQDGTGGWAITLPASVTNKTELEADQDTTASQTTLLVLLSRDGGATWYGGWWGGSGGSDLTVEDEGTPLATFATTLDFVGDGVVASGTGAEKTITISGAPTGAAGGDLSGTYPNPSVLDDSHSHTGAVGPLLISDTHSTPIIFADILLTEDEDDFLYADV